MKDLLLVLFYQAIVAVNTAVILSGIIWLAKRKEEKEERKQNPDFTQPPTVRRGGYQPKPSGTPKPPTTGTNAITPKEHKYDKFSCLCFLFCDLTREQVLDGLDRYIKGFSPNDLLDRFENEIRKRIKDDQRTGSQPIQSFIGEVRGGPGNEVMGTVTAKSAEELEEKLKALSDTLDRTDKKPVTPERLKEAGFGVEFIDAKCQNCKHYLATDEEATTGLCGKMEEIVFADAGRACFEAREKPRTDHLCGDCCHFAASYVDEYEKPWGVCRKRNDPRHYGADVGCGRWQEKPATLGTVTTH